MKLRIEGTVAPGYESIQHLYLNNMHRFAERNTQLCIYVDNRCVVDLWATAIEDERFNGDSLINVFSSGKSLESLLLAMLCDRGLLDYNATIAQYWPEFGVGNKDSITIADLMRHEAGLAAFDVSLEPESLAEENLSQGSVSSIIEAQAQHFRSGEDKTREYHAATRGWIANELFRRVEPKGRTMGRFLREEISEPMGIDVFIGLRDEELDKVSPVAMLGIGYQLAQGLLPKVFGRRTELNTWHCLMRLGQIWRARKERSKPNAPPPIAGTALFSLFDTVALCKGETPSAGAKCSARGLARLAAVLANGGTLQSHTLLGEAAHQALHDKPINADMGLVRTSFSQGGVALFGQSDSQAGRQEVRLNRGREGYYGWFGLGGSIFQWNPEHKVGFAYIPTSLNLLDMFNERGKSYQAEALACAKRLAT